MKTDKNNNNTYGVMANGEYTDVSNSLLGAKQYASRNGYDEVYKRFNNGYVTSLTVVKVGKKWINHRMHEQTYNFLKTRGYNPYRFFELTLKAFENGETMPSQLGDLIDSQKDCLLFIDYKQTIILSPTTGVHTLNERNYNQRVKEHWKGFLSNQ